MNTDQNRVFLAVVLSGLVLIAWQFFYAPKFDGHALKPAVGIPQTSSSVDATQPEINSNLKEEVAQPSGSPVPVTDQIFDLAFDDAKLSISNTGRITDIVVPNTVYTFQDVVGEAFDMGFSVVKTSNESKINFTKAVLDEAGKRWIISDENLGVTLVIARLETYFSFSIQMSNPARLSILLKTTEKKSENGKTRDYLFFKDKPIRYHVAKDSSEEGKLRWFGLDYHYHIFALVNDDFNYSIKLTEDGTAKFTTLADISGVDYKLVFLKKNYDLLTSVGSNLDQAVDFGLFGIVAVPILRMLQYFYKYIPNYGIAIILLTIIIRLLTFPLQFKSFKSMKKMQNIQPEINKLREKFKDDPQRMQKETMELFKRSGANPLGGCFPMLLQMPIFIAFYQVLSNSVELVGAPFYFWLNDLSLKDPFYVLPILMGIVMFLQSKLNPTPMTDPTQKKMMMFMPVVFTFIMKDLPSGLNLYMTFSIALGIGQQLLVYKLSD